MTRISLAFAALALIGASARDARAQAPVAAPASPASARAARADTNVAPAAAVRGAGPNGATLRCRDGSYPPPLSPESSCEQKGGVLVRFPLIKTPKPIEQPAAQAGVRAAPEAAPAVAPPPRASRANVFVPAEAAPVNARLQCGDGTYIVADTTSSRCAGKGGVKVRLRAPRPE